MAISWLMQSDGRVAGSAGPLFFMSATKPATVEVLELIEPEIFRVAKQHGPISFLMLIRPNRAESVSNEARERLAKMLKKIGPVCLGQAMVIDAKGLLGTIVRAFLTGLTLMSADNGYPTKVFATVPEGFEWLANLPKQDAGFHLYRREIDAYLNGQRKLSA